MQAAGLSRFRLAAPALQVACLVAVIGYAIALYIQPVSYSRFKEMQSFLRNNYASILLQEGVFSSPVDGLTVFIRDRDEAGILHGILVHDNRQKDAPITMMAEEGKLVETPQGPRFLLVNGNRQEISEGRISFLNFASYTMDISLYTQTANKRLPDVQELLLPQLFTYDHSVSAAENQKRFAEGHQRLLWSAYSITMTFIALAVLLSGEFNRRGQWKRMAVAIMLGTLVLFGSVGLRGMMALNPVVVVAAYLNLILPCAVASWVLSGYEFKMGSRIREVPAV